MTLTVFEYMIFISIDIYNFVSHFSFSFDWEDISNTKDSVWPKNPKTLKFVRNTLLCVVFSTLFSVLGDVVTHSLLYLIHYIIKDGCLMTPCYPVLSSHHSLRQQASFKALIWFGISISIHFMPPLEVVPYPRHAMWHIGPSLEVVLTHFTKDSNKPGKSKLKQQHNYYIGVRLHLYDLAMWCWWVKT